MTAASFDTIEHRREGRAPAQAGAGPRRSSRWPEWLAFIAQAALAQDARSPAEGRGAAAAGRAGRGAAGARRPGAAARHLHHRQPGAARRSTCPGTTLGARRRAASTSTSGGVDTIVAAEASGRTRVVFNLDQHAALRDPRRRQHGLRDLGQRRHGGAPVATAATASASGGDGRARRGVGRSRRSTSAAAPTAPAASSCTPATRSVQASLKQEGGRIVVDFPNTTGAATSTWHAATTWWISPRRSVRST